jgi:hypothetical protein
VKLFIHYEFQPPGGWAMGTGWLIKDDLLVTAGHCSYDWKYKWGRATEVKAYIGYKGKKSVSDRNVQFRSVKRIVTTEGWLKAKGAKNFDVSFMQVDKPFTGITPFKFEETPATGDEVLGVVGYPGDLKDQGEGGALMYEMFLQVSMPQRAFLVAVLTMVRPNGIFRLRRTQCWSIKLILLEVRIAFSIRIWCGKRSRHSWYKLYTQCMHPSVPTVPIVLAYVTSSVLQTSRILC